MVDLLLFAVIGFAAQIIDGAIGMAYGLTATSVLLSVGVPPATASASVHAAEMVTTGASGLSHWKLGNVNTRLVVRLAIPGMFGGAVGAWALSRIDATVIRPWVAGYLMAMGLLILYKALRRRPAVANGERRAPLLGLAGGFLDAIGGGGWGPLVASSLIGSGTRARIAIGSSNLAEFFVTSVVSATFVLTIGLDLWPIITGLVLGGVLAAPFAALLTRRLPERPLMLLVATVVTLLSLRNLMLAL